MADQIRDVVEAVRPWPLVLIGPAGTGKTCAALSIIDGVYGDAPYNTVATMMADLISAQNGELADSNGNKKTCHVWWREWSGSTIAVLDEFGARGKVTDYQYECVKRAIDERQGKPAIFISNVELPQIEKLYDDRISSRLAAGTVVVMAGEDRRVRT